MPPHTELGSGTGRELNTEQRGLPGTGPFSLSQPKGDRGVWGDDGRAISQKNKSSAVKWNGSYVAALFLFHLNEQNSAILAEPRGARDAHH